jgi:hypothetical protein
MNIHVLRLMEPIQTMQLNKIKLNYSNESANNNAI